MIARRPLLLSAAALCARPGFAASKVAAEFAQVSPGALVFPRDHGAHHDFRIEWWYLTAVVGGADAADAAPPLGLQVTFFRIRPPITPGNPSRFAAHHLLIAHAAIADPAHGKLFHGQRIARTGSGGVRADAGDTDLALDRWSLRRNTDGAYRCSVQAAGFGFDFTATPTQPLLLQGERGYSRKGPPAADGRVPASLYYSQPQLAVRARVRRGDTSAVELTGRAWLDHEWSSDLMPREAVGWDWLGLNLSDGSALTAARMRRADGSTLFAYASLRALSGGTQVFAPEAVRFAPLSWWVSPRTGARYPVAMRVDVGARTFDTEPLLPDQELDSRATTGAVYWEGASHVLEQGRDVGRGYLELTGYLAPIVI